MSQMFSNIGLAQINVSSFNTSKVNNEQNVLQHSYNNRFEFKQFWHNKCNKLL